MVFQARGPSLMAALGPGVGICGRPGGLKKKVVLREMDVERVGRIKRGLGRIVGPGMNPVQGFSDIARTPLGVFASLDRF